MRLLTAMLALAVLAVLTAGPARAQVPVPGQAAAEAILVAGVEVPLPPGSWKVYYVNDSALGAYPRTDVGLMRVHGRIVRQTIYATVAHARKGDGFRPYANCAVDHYSHAVERVNRHGHEQDCWHVRPVDLAAGNKPSENRQALFSSADGAADFLPVAMIGARFHLADRHLLLRVAYNWTPDLMLPARGERKFWVFEDWTRAAVEENPPRRAVVKTVTAWAEGWQARVQNAFINAERGRE